MKGKGGNGDPVNPRIVEVKPNPDYSLTLKFTNGEVRRFDVRPYLDKGIFAELKDMYLFNSVKPSLGSIQWLNGQDLCPDTLYLDSQPLSS
jgi:hypothetical protein